jgi:tetratricopeptide (TPR) repeat protein
MSARLRIPLLIAAACLLPVPAIAQKIGTPLGGGAGDNTILGINKFQLQQGHWLVSGKVTTLRGDPVAHAKVDVVPTGSQGEFRSMLTDSRGEFRTDYWLNAERVKEFAIELNVTKKGFLRAHAYIYFGSSRKTWVIPVTLREPKEDPDLLPQADLISGLAPRLNKLEASDGLSPAGEKDYARGVADFLQENRPDRAVPFFNKVTRGDASCMPCRTMLALAELDSGDWDGAYYDLVEVFNKILADRSLGRPEPFVALGVMESWRHKPMNAAGYFAEALKFAPQDPLALQEMGRSQLLIENWPAADEDLAKAIAAGAKPEARLLRARALFGENQFQAACTELAHYLNGRDVKEMPIQVRKLWVEIENQKKNEAAYAKANPNDVRTLDYLHRPPHDLPGLDPAADQRPLDSILSSVGKTVADFFTNFPNTSSVEQIHQEKLGRKDKVGATLDQKFRYLCFAPARAFGPGFDEYRSNAAGIQAWPQGLGDGFMLTSGFASASLVFHPAYQSQSEFRYLGRQKANGRDAFVIAFAQQPGKARLNGTFVSGHVIVTTYSQGLAWIDSQNYQIIRLRTDLLKPSQEIHLEKETTDITYGEVHFKDLPIGFWVPKEVTVAVDWNNRHLRNEHRYSEFKVFNVEATEKHGQPKELGQFSKPASESQVPH